MNEVCRGIEFDSMPAIALVMVQMSDSAMRSEGMDVPVQPMSHPLIPADPLG